MNQMDKNVTFETRIPNKNQFHKLEYLESNKTKKPTQLTFFY